MTLFVRLARVVGHFWVDFLFGDSVVLAPGTLVILGVAYLLRRHGIVPVVVVPLLVAALVAATAFQGRRRPGAPTPPADHEES